MLDIISFDITSHPLISIHAPPMHPFRMHLTSAQSFDRISHPIIIVDNTQFPLVCEAAKLVFQ